MKTVSRVFFFVFVSDGFVNSYTRMKRDGFEMRFQPARTEQGRSLPDNRGDTPGNSSWGVYRPVLQILTLISDQKMSFSSPVLRPGL